MKLGCTRVDQSLVGVQTGVVVEPASSQGKTGGSRGGTAASTYGLCLHMYTCPNLPHWYNAPDGQESQEDAGVCWSCAGLIGIVRDNEDEVRNNEDK